MIRNIFGTFALMFLLTAGVSAQIGHYGVCVGINDYPGTINDLSYCVYDAQQMSYALQYYQGWTASHVTLKTDAQATKTNILNAVSAMPRSSSYTDLFHYSGHGDIPASGLWTRRIYPPRISKVRLGPITINMRPTLTLATPEYSRGT